MRVLIASAAGGVALFLFNVAVSPWGIYLQQCATRACEAAR